MESVTSAKKPQRSEVRSGRTLKTEPGVEKKENLKMNDVKKEEV